MSSSNIVKPDTTTDILTVMRELENGQSQRKVTDRPLLAVDGRKDASAPADTPNPIQLRDSLKKKRELLSLIDGYADVKGLDSMKAELNDAISFLDKFIEDDGVRCES